MNGQKVLLVEDDVRVREQVQEALAQAGLHVLGSDTLAGARRLFADERPDLLVVDVGLPDGNGLDFCREIRGQKERPATPVIMLTGKGELEEKAAGFDAGADQYLVKPVAPSEVVLWAQALLRRLDMDSGRGAKDVRLGDMELDTKAYLVRWQGTPIPLTVKEFELLYFLVRKRPQVVTRKQVLSQLWHTIAVDHVVDVHLMKIRRKLPPPIADRIQTIPGKGFRFLE